MDYRKSNLKHGYGAYMLAFIRKHEPAKGAHVDSKTPIAGGNDVHGIYASRGTYTAEMG